MNVEITGRQIAVTPALREYTQDKLRKLERFLDDPIEAHVVLEISKHRHVAEIQIKSGAVSLNGTEETGDLYASILVAVEKLERQARKHKGRVRTRKRGQSPRAAAVAVQIQDGDVAQAREQPSESIDDERPRIVRSQSYRVKPMSPDDAMIELQDSGETMLVFRESRDYRINVLYRREDGNYGLIDPEF